MTAVAEAGEGRARVWRLYMAASAVSFEHRLTEIHQVLAVKPDDGRSGLPLRPRFTVAEVVMTRPSVRRPSAGRRVGHRRCRRAPSGSRG